MKKALLVFLLIFFGSVAAFADGIDCTNKADSRMRVLCSDTDRMVKAIYLEVRYLSMLEKATTVQEWDAVRKPKLKWLSLWTVCNVYNGEKQVSCIDDALRESETMFPFVDVFPEVDERKARIKIKKHQTIEAALQASMLCAISKAETLDDGVSPASDIAMGVARACKQFANDRASVYVSSFGAESVFDSSPMTWQNEFELARNYSDPANFVDTVLEARAIRRAKAMQKQPALQQKKQIKKQVES
jgi:hypothetical protein